MELSYFCKHCNRHFFKYIPNCEINKEVSECKFCGKKATFDKEDFMDTVIKNIQETRKAAQEAHREFQEAHEIVTKGE